MGEKVTGEIGDEVATKERTFIFESFGTKKTIIIETPVDEFETLDANVKAASSENIDNTATDVKLRI